MNQQPDTQTPQLPPYIEGDLWAQRDRLPKLHPAAAVLLLLFASLSSGAFAPTGAGILTVALDASVFAFLLLLWRTPLCWLSVPVAFLFSFLLYRNVLLCVSSLFFAPLGAILALCIFRRRKCAPTVLRLTLCMLVLVGGHLLLLLHEAYGSISAIVAEVSGMIETTAKATLEDMASNADSQTLYEYYERFIKTDLPLILQYWPLMIPGIALFTFMLFSWISCRFTKLLTRIFRAETAIFKRKWAVMVPLWWVVAFVATAVLYVVSTFLSYLKIYLPMIIAADLLFIVAPPLFAIGFRRMANSLRRIRAAGSNFPYMMIIVIMIAMLCCAWQVVLIAMTFYGALYVVQRYRRRKTAAADPLSGGTSGTDSSDEV